MHVRIELFDFGRERAKHLAAIVRVAEMRSGGLQPGEMALEQVEAVRPLAADGLDQLEGRIGLGEEMCLQQALVEFGVGVKIGDDAGADAHLARPVGSMKSVRMATLKLMSPEGAIQPIAPQ